MKPRAGFKRVTGLYAFWAYAGLLFALAACDQLFNLQEIHYDALPCDACSDGRTDSHVPDAPPIDSPISCTTNAECAAINPNECCVSMDHCALGVVVSGLCCIECV
jgi:hypothetical protein